MNHLLLKLPALALLVVAGCTQSSSSDEPPAEARLTPNTRMPEPVNLKANVPPRAVEVARNVGGLTYEAETDGTMYLYDLQANQRVATFNVQTGQTLRVAGTANRITLDGNELSHEASLSPAKTYIVYVLGVGGPSQSSAAPASNNRPRFSIPVEVEDVASE
ncbi:MAG: hypothetical protein AAGI46_02810 [Planctomycetota bacterium]